MKNYKREFIEFALQCNALKFGQFTLKSGRISPYFFNTGLFNTGYRLRKLGHFYAHALIDSGMDYNILYGPAYKGIPLVCAVSIGLSEVSNQDIPYVFNRKEVKDHGEGGTILGAPLKGKILIVDDVISAGTSVNESVEIIRSCGAQPAAVMISLNRQERGKGETTAITEVERDHGLAVSSIVTLFNILEYLEKKGGYLPEIAAIREYHHEFGA